MGPMIQSALPLFLSVPLAIIWVFTPQVLVARAHSCVISKVSIESTEKKGEIQAPREKSAHAKRVTESYEVALIKTIVVLVALLVLATLTIWMFKKLSHGRLRSFNHMKSVKILEKRALSPKSMLYLIEIGKKQILLAESQITVSKIDSLEGLDTDKDL